MNMLRVAIITRDSTIADQLDNILQNSGLCASVKQSRRYLPAVDVNQFLGASSAQMVFVDVTPWASAVHTLRNLRAAFPNLPIAAVHKSIQPIQTTEILSLRVVPLAFPTSQSDCETFLKSAREKTAESPS